MSESHFLPGSTLQFAWDSTALSDALACKRRYYYRTIKGLGPKQHSVVSAEGEVFEPDPRQNVSFPLLFGILFHKGQEIWHHLRADGVPASAAAAQALKAVLQLPETALLPTPDWLAKEKTRLGMEAEEDNDEGGKLPFSFTNAALRTRYHLARALVWYFEEYAHDNLRTIILKNGKPATELSVRMELPGVSIAGVPAILSGHLDRGVEMDGFSFVEDYKTTKSLSRGWASTFDLSHQMSGYTLLGSTILERPLAGVIISGIQLGEWGTKFRRFKTRRTPGQIVEFLNTVQTLFNELEEAAETSNYPMNTSACFLCDFKGLCAKAPEIRAQYEEQMFTLGNFWQPLEER